MADPFRHRPLRFDVPIGFFRYRRRETIMLGVGAVVAVGFTIGLVAIAVRLGLLRSETFAILEAAINILVASSVAVAYVVLWFCRTSRNHVAVDRDGFLCSSDGTRVRPREVSSWEVDNGEHFLRVQGATDTPRRSLVDLDLGPFEDPSEAELLERRLVAAAR